MLFFDTYTNGLFCICSSGWDLMGCLFTPFFSVVTGQCAGLFLLVTCIALGGHGGVFCVTVVHMYWVGAAMVIHNVVHEGCMIMYFLHYVI